METMSTYEQLVSKIIKEQANVIGPLAVEQAQKVPGLIINNEASEIKFNGDQKNIVNELISKYQSLFGKASLEVCRDATRNIRNQMNPDEIPQALL